MYARLRKWMRHLAGLDDPPAKIARGLALGIFIGFLPIMGIQMAAVLPFALLFRGNKMAAVAGVWISNPVTVIPIYFLDYLVGVAFTPYQRLTWADFSSQFTATNMTKFLALGERLVVPLFVGGAILGVIAGIPTYFVTKAMVTHTRELRRRRRARREASRPAIRIDLGARKRREQAERRRKAASAPPDGAGHPIHTTVAGNPEPARPPRAGE